MTTITFPTAKKYEKSIVLLLNDNVKLAKEAARLDKEFKGVITRAAKVRGFEGKKGEYFTITAPSDACEHIIVIGLGDQKTCNAQIATEIGGVVASRLMAEKINAATLLAQGCSASIAASIAYGVSLRCYDFTKYRSKETEKEVQEKQGFLERLAVVADDQKQAKAEYQALAHIASGVHFARDLVSEPPNHLHPESYASMIKKQLTKAGATVKILGEKQMKKLGMGALLGVGQGSECESQLVVIEWRGNKKSKEVPVALVGKGVTFDTGGISLKPSSGMEDMKYDMGGSAAVVGAMYALALRKAKINAVGIVGLVENMPGSRAQRPSDVVTSMSGQTVEVLNTDAEGRLVLADALWYAQEQYKPKAVVNLATLTGAIVVALGYEHAGLFSNDDTLSKQLTEAGKQTEEKIWRFPLSKAYDQLLHSPIADMQNISSGRGAGSITAAQFLQRFIQDGVAWAHLDIAGMAWAKKANDVCPKGASGFGVRLLNEWIASCYE